jgi:hypothetical protein
MGHQIEKEEQHMADTKKAPPKTEEFVPTEEQILRELRQAEKRKAYMQSPKAKENRKKYAKKRYEELKAVRAAIKELKEKDPAKYNQLMAKVKSAK